MVEIEDPRGLTFKSWKAYAKFCELEVKQLQQLLPSEDVKNAFEGTKRAAKYKKIKFEDSTECPQCGCSTLKQDGVELSCSGCEFSEILDIADFPKLQF